MQSESENPASGPMPTGDGSSSVPPVVPPPIGPGWSTAGSAAPPILTASSTNTSGDSSLANLLSLCLALFLADGLVSLADDGLIQLFGVHVLTGFRGLLFLFTVLVCLLVYVLMAITPMIPKRIFLPVTLFNLVAALAIVPVWIYVHGQRQLVACMISALEVALGFGILLLVQGGFRLRWPLIGKQWLGTRRFSWLNLLGFAGGNVVVLLPAIVLYLLACAGLAVGHFSDGFLALRPGGVHVRVRTYERADGKQVRLVPMMHVGDPEFYRTLSQSFPTNGVVLMEGVTDEQNLLTNKVSYERMASALGVAEQQKEFQPVRVHQVPADVDVSDFTTNTVALLNLVMLVHKEGVTPENVRKLLGYSPPPNLEEELLNDLLRNRNRRVLEEMERQLPDYQTLVVPWGAAHMPGIAKDIQKAGFKLAETRDYVVLRFGGRAATGRSPAEAKRGTSLNDLPGPGEGDS